MFFLMRSTSAPICRCFTNSLSRMSNSPNMTSWMRFLASPDRLYDARIAAPWDAFSASERPTVHSLIDMPIFLTPRSMDSNLMMIWSMATPPNFHVLMKMLVVTNMDPSASIARSIPSTMPPDMTLAHRVDISAFLPIRSSMVLSISFATLNAPKSATSF